ncbi:ankyrin repeat domain-containing protein 17 [Biomphalaria glabrata]|nr:ankyrin repeat domain-containing protein 17-like [Biomphalaria glabrata]
MAYSPHPSSNDSSLIQAITSSEQLSAVTHNLLHNKSLFSINALNYCLLYSCGNGPNIVVQALLEAGAHLECRDDRGNTPLMISVINDQISITALLLSKCPDVNACNNVGDTALIVSTYFKSSHKALKLLLESKDINLEHRNLNGFTALECAIQANNIEALLLLINANAVCELPQSDTFGNVTSMNQLQTNVYTCSRNNGTLNLIKCFKLQKLTGRSAISLASQHRDLRTLHFLTSMEPSVLNSDCDTYLISLIEFLKSRTQLTISNSEMDIFKLLTNTYVLLRTCPANTSSENQVMELAVKIGNTVVIELLCENNFSISNDVLGTVAASGSYFLLEMLIKHGAAISKVDNANRFQYRGSALEIAIQNEEFECANLLLNSAAFFDFSEALKLAVESSTTKCLKYLFNKFPEKTKSTDMPSDVLHTAIFHGNSSIINMLLDKGVSVDAKHDKKTPLMAAVDLEVVDLLVSRGADVNMVISSDFSFKLILHYFVSFEYFRYLKTKYTERSDAFIKMLQAGLIQLLTHHGARVDSRDYFERTPLMVAAKTHDSCDVIKVLIGAGAKVDELGLAGETALQVAVQSGGESNVRCLLQYGADINAQSDNLLFECSDTNMLSLLLENKASVTAEDLRGNTALMHHMRFCDEELIQLLIEAQSDVNHTNKEGKSPLLLAAKSNNVEIMSSLLRSGADVNYSVTKNDKEISAVSILMKRLRTYRAEVTACLGLLLDHGLTSKTIPPSLVHALISMGCFSLVTKYISVGLAPTVVHIQWPVTAWLKTDYCISPLDAALMMKNVQLAEYFMNIRFLTSKDVQMLSQDQDIKPYFQSKSRLDIVSFLDQHRSQPLSLQTLSFVVVSQALGTGSRRTDAIKTCGLPVPLQEALMFQSAPHDMEDKQVMKRFLFRSALHQAKLYNFDPSYMDMNFEYDSDYESDSDSDEN